MRGVFYCQSAVSILAKIAPLFPTATHELPLQAMARRGSVVPLDFFVQVLPLSALAMMVSWAPTATHELPLQAMARRGSVVPLDFFVQPFVMAPVLP